MTPLVDYHCHLDLYPDFEQLITDCETNHIFTLAVTTTPKAWPRNHQLISNRQFVRAALGLHPQLVADRANEISLWKEYLPSTRYVGEIGLDAGPKFYHSFELQKEVFKEILQSCSSSGDKILSIHSVRSASVVLDMIEKYLNISKNKVVLHWFTGSNSELKRAIDLGCYFSINAEMSKSIRSQELIPKIPRQLILTETDGPFTTVNQEPARPRHITKTIDLLSRLIKFPIADLADKIHSNMQTLES